jgi:hypothetical protein
MTLEDIARLRGVAQRLTRQGRETPAALVGRLGAMQAQDLPLARWSVAQRISRGTLARVDAALADGTVLRTHILRPTWHFVARDDLRWMQALTAPRVLALVAYSDRRNGVDRALVASSTRTIAAAIGRRGHLTRREIADALARSGIRVNPWLVSQLLIHAELRAVVCSGMPRGKDQTYALVEQRAPRSHRFDGDEAAAELAARYFISHGPATLKDFRWWSGLDATTAARGVAALGRRIDRFEFGGRTYLGGAASARAPATAVQLIQPFDELAVAYSESRDAIDASGAARARGWGLLVRGIVVGGQLTGRWSRAENRKPVSIATEMLRRLTAAERAAVDRAVDAFGRDYFAWRGSH